MMLQFYFGPLVLHSSNAVLLLEPAQKPFYTLTMASPVDCTICHNLNVGRITINIRIADTTSVAGRGTYSFTTWHPLLLECVCHGFSSHFSFFLFIAMWFMHMLSKVLNVPIVMHVNIDYYMHNAYVNYDSTLHKIPN